MDLKNVLSPLNADGNLRQELALLLELFGIPTEGMSLVDLRDLTMARWVSKGRERWELPEVTLADRVLRAEFWQLVNELPMYGEIRPTDGRYRYDHVLVLGGSLYPQDRKNELVVRLWQQGIEFGAIAHLGGDRKLNEERESILTLGTQQSGGLPIMAGWNESWVERYLTEADMLKALWERSELPDEMYAIPTSYIGSEARDGFRANTGDTYKDWLAMCPTGSRVLVVSISPHGPFQYWDAVNILEPAGFEVHLAAPGAQLGPQRLDYFLGAIPRWLRSYLRATG